MSDYQLSAFLILLGFLASFSFCRCAAGQQFDSGTDGQKIKSNDRRASGLVPYPRIGRNSDASNFPRSDRAAGLVHYPRVGRSDLPVSNVNLNRYRDAESELDLEFYSPHDLELLPPVDQEDYDGGYLERPMNLRHTEKLVKDGVWLLPDNTHAIKEYRPAQKIDDFRSIYSTIRGPRNNQGQLTINGYTPRLGRETERDVVMSFL